MLRRNGKPTSCEPCRISKVRCDHTRPVCRRCKSKGFTSQCYYHPAPLTKSKTQEGISPVLAGRPKPKRIVRPRKEQEIPPTNTQRKGTLPIGPSTRASSPSNFLGTTSYLSVFTETPWWGSRISSNRSLQDEYEYWRTNHAYTCARLVRLVCAVDFLVKHVDWYYARGRFTTIPAPLVLEPLRLLQEHVEKNAWNQEGNWKDIYDRITAATSQPLEFSGDTTAREFCALFTGENLRWEFIGLVFALAGGSVQRQYKGSHILDLGNGEEIDADTFAQEMVLASNACIEICRQNGHVNDLIIWMRQAYYLFGTSVLGENSERLYNVFGDIVSNIYAMGLHSSHHSDDVPFFIAETRKRVLASIHKSDKNVATFFGRPPRLPYQYCDFVLALDLSDDQLFLDERSLQDVLSKLDDQGWNSQGLFYPATVIRMRHILTTLGEEMLLLSLGSKNTGYQKDLSKTYRSCQETWDKIPARFRYNSNCWLEKDHNECLARAIVYLEYLLNVFQIQRLRRQERPEATKDLLDTSMQLLSVIVDMIRQFQKHEAYKQYPWIFLVYGIPAAGVLVTEVRRHTISNQPLPSSYPRSEVIRRLSFVTSWFHASELPFSNTRTTCMELIQLINRLLNEALDYQGPSSSSNFVGGTNLQDDDSMNVVTPSLITVPTEISEEDGKLEPQNQLEELIGEGTRGGMEPLWFGMGVNLGASDDIALETDMNACRDG